MQYVVGAIYCWSYLISLLKVLQNPTTLGSKGNLLLDRIAGAHIVLAGSKALQNGSNNALHKYVEALM